MPRRGGRPSRQYLEDTKRMQEKRKLREVGMLTGGQAKIAAKAPPTNKIDAKDFAVLRAEKAKGRGMGLQDEKVKPGKVMKAKRGTSIQGTTSQSAKGKTFRGYSKVFDTAVKAGEKASGTSTIVGVKPNPKKSVAKSKRVTYKSMDEMRQKTLGYKPGESTEAFKKRIAKENFAKRAAKATGPRGKAALAVATAGVAGYQYLKSKMKKKDEPKKKMGGGMMKRPMGYKKGKEIDYGKIFDKKFYKSALGKEAQLHADDYDAGLDRAERRAASETMALMKKNKKMGGGMMKVPGYSEGSPKTDEQRRRSRGPQQPRSKSRRTVAGAGIGALGGVGSKKDSLAMSQYKTYKSEVESDFSKLKRLSKETKGASPNIQKNVEKKFKPFIDTYGTDKRIKASRRDAAKTFMMGGGMMNKPMGYKSGKSIKVKCKLGKNKPTKMY